MAFNIIEIKYINSLLDKDFNIEDNLDKFDETEINFIRTGNYQALLSDNFFINQKARYNFTSHVVITKFISKNINIGNFVSSIIEEICGPCYISLDFHAIYDSPLTATQKSLIEKSQYSSLKLEFGSQFSSVIPEGRLISLKDREETVDWLKRKSNQDFLTLSFNSHLNMIYDRYQSGFRPRKLLSILVHISKIKQSSF